eukprot:364496-Chlamydomonas_euryale.AAC.1
MLWPAVLQDGADMRAAIKNRAPSKIDIGPVYSANPQERLKFGAAGHRHWTDAYTSGLSAPAQSCPRRSPNSRAEHARTLSL